MLTIRLAKTAGFCMGVRRAMNITLEKTRDGEPLQTLGPLIHNPQILGILERKGVAVASRPEEITAPQTVVRTHGVPPQVMRQLRERPTTVIDATCPHVTRIHRIIEKHSAQGYAIIIVGDQDHAEVQGLVGFSRTPTYVVQEAEQVAAIPAETRVCCVAQTTQDIERFTRVKHAVLERFAHPVIIDTICLATQKRQDEVRRLAGEVEVMVVVGGRNSANTTRLYQIALEINPRTIQIETEEELDPKDFRGVNRVGVTAGASTPHWLINRTIEKLESLHWQNRNIFLRTGWGVLQVLVNSKLYLLLGIAGLSALATQLLGYGFNPRFLGITSFYLLSMYILNRLTDRDREYFQEIARSDYVFRFRWFYQGLSLVLSLAAAALAWFVGRPAFLLVVMCLVAGAAYNFPVLPRNFKNRRSKDFPLSKDLGITLAWVGMLAGIPALAYDPELPGWELLLTVVFIANTVFVRTVLFDMQDIQRDRLVGRETLPIFLGENWMRIICIGLTAGSAALHLALWAAGKVEPGTAWFLLAQAYLLAVMLAYFRAGRLRAVWFELAVDFTFILAGIIAGARYLYERV